MELSDVVDYRFLASIWTIRLFVRCCDICKEFRFENPEINSRYTTISVTQDVGDI